MASTAIETVNYSSGNGPVIITLAITADAADASIDDISLGNPVNNYLIERGMYFYQMDSYPDGVTPMTDQYDVYVKNALGKDLLRATGENRSNVNIETAQPYYKLVISPEIVDSALTVSISNNAVNSGATTLKLMFGIGNV